MKKLLITAAICAVMTTGVASANAPEQDFAFSYTFSSGDIINGTFLGNFDATGTNVVNITNVNASLDGVQFLNDAAISSLDVTAWNTSTGTWDNTIAPVVSTKGDRNYKHTVLGKMVISHQCKAGERCSRCSSSAFALPPTFTPFS